MVDKPDLNKLKGKLDLGGIVDSLKSMINPATGTPEVDPDDDLGVKIAQVSVLLKEMVQAQQEHVKNINKVNELLNAVYADIEALRKSVAAQKGESEAPSAKAETETKTDVEKKAAAEQTAAPEKKSVEAEPEVTSQAEKKDAE